MFLQGTQNCFIDTPGIGENKEITQMVTEYVQKAFAFIYVVNSSNADGVQHDRVS